ncbi:MAG TPA: phosphatase PAP2 family protein [Mucilaginibacter sp.]|jgi:undecaprenyl-diphosphatase|nr:phosphatase PAP2 family protein [Mucilaginibacter sp.]
MPDFLLQFDRHVFHFINHDLANPFFDAVMPWLRTPKNWIPLYIVIIALCVWKFKKAGLVIVVLMALSAGFADFTSAQLVKPLVKRVRPCRDVIVSKTDIVRVGCGTGYSFPSTHATDHFAVAFFAILLFYKKWRWIWFWGIFWAGLISFAQVYVGVHFPIDVFCGALYGAFVGWLFTLLFWKVNRTYRLNFN